MDNNTSTPEKYEFIIKNTVIDVNRVLQNWKENDKIITYEDKLSLFRSYFAKYFKHQFNYQTYNRYISKYCILPVINNYILIDIHMIDGNVYRENIYIESLKKALQTINILKISETLKNVSNLESLVNYESITNIKFK